MITVAAKPEFVLAQHVDAEAQKLCLNIQEMLRRAAICTLPQGNRRFRDWVFDVRSGVVVAMTFIGGGTKTTAVPSSPPRSQPKVTQKIAVHGEALKPNEFVMYEDCENCGGEGECLVCDDGQVQVVRTLKKTAT